MINVLTISKETKRSTPEAIVDWELLAQVSQMFRTVSDTFMDLANMHRAQAMLLCRLFVKDGVTQSEIAEQLSVQGATVSNMLQRLEEAGLVVRRRDADDNRLVRVYLSEQGRDKERAIHQQIANLEETIFAGISEEDRVVLRRLLKQLLSNMSVAK
jgi:MarR family transcriptional regulator, organic hydroperoxide resistance regulator